MRLGNDLTAQQFLACACRAKKMIAVLSRELPEEKHNFLRVSREAKGTEGTRKSGIRVCVLGRRESQGKA